MTITSDDLGNFGSGGALTDTDTVAITVTAVNDTPVITSVSASPDSIDEGDSTTVSVTFHRRGTPATAHTCMFAWGDGSTDTTVAADTTSCSSGAHTYADDNASDSSRSS